MGWESGGWKEVRIYLSNMNYKDEDGDGWIQIARLCSTSDEQLKANHHRRQIDRQTFGSTMEKGDDIPSMDFGTRCYTLTDILIHANMREEIYENIIAT